MTTCLNCGKMKHNRVMQGCTCQYSMQAPLTAQPAPVKFKCTVVDNQNPQGISLEKWCRPAQEPVETYIHEYTSQPHPRDFGIPKGHWWKAKQYADALAQPAYRAVKTVHEGKPVYVAQHDEDDDTQGFEPDWANFEEGRKVGRAEAFERIADKVKEMPWENDTKDSFLIWLKEQNI